jgi:hypothetical protein
VTKDEELDLLATWINPMLQPDKRFMALAGAALPVLIDRAGGSVRFTLAEFEAVQSRYGGKVAVTLKKSPDNVFYRHARAQQEQGSRTRA